MLPWILLAQTDSSMARHSLFTKVLQSHVEDGLVNYAGFKSDTLFEQYLQVLAVTDPATLNSREEHLAFWINAYNAYTIKLIVERMPLESIRDISLGLPILFGPWSIDIADIGGGLYTLNEIEHDIIRDEFADPRIHFALVCAALSCPKLREESYEGSTLNAQLDEDARRFLNDPERTQFDLEAHTVYLSKIFDWYDSDFEESAGSVRSFISRYVPHDEKLLIESEDVEIEYLPYDWALNAR
jgi:hypothetical protein